MAGHLWVISIRKISVTKTEKSFSLRGINLLGDESAGHKSHKGVHIRSQEKLSVLKHSLYQNLVPDTFFFPQLKTKCCLSEKLTPEEVWVFPYISV